jgi:hypothetical protein
MGVGGVGLAQAGLDDMISRFSIPWCTMVLIVGAFALWGWSALWINEAVRAYLAVSLRREPDAGLTWKVLFPQKPRPTGDPDLDRELERRWAEIRRREVRAFLIFQASLFPCVIVMLFIC